MFPMIMETRSRSALYSEIKQTRSGRVVLPRLSYWLGEQVTPTLRNIIPKYIRPNTLEEKVARYILPTDIYDRRKQQSICNSAHKNKKTSPGKMSHESNDRISKRNSNIIDFCDAIDPIISEQSKKPFRSAKKALFRVSDESVLSSSTTEKSCEINALSDQKVLRGRIISKNLSFKLSPPKSSTPKKSCNSNVLSNQTVLRGRVVSKNLPFKLYTSKAFKNSNQNSLTPSYNYISRKNKENTSLNLKVPKANHKPIPLDPLISPSDKCLRSMSRNITFCKRNTNLDSASKVFNCSKKKYSSELNCSVSKKLNGSRIEKRIVYNDSSKLNDSTEKLCELENKKTETFSTRIKRRRKFPQKCTIPSLYNAGHKHVGNRHGQQKNSVTKSVNDTNIIPEEKQVNNLIPEDAESLQFHDNDTSLNTSNNSVHKCRSKRIRRKFEQDTEKTNQNKIPLTRSKVSKATSTNAKAKKQKKAVKRIKNSASSPLNNNAVLKIKSISIDQLENEKFNSLNDNHKASKDTEIKKINLTKTESEKSNLLQNKSKNVKLHKSFSTDVQDSPCKIDDVDDLQLCDIISGKISDTSYSTPFSALRRSSFVTIGSSRKCRAPKKEKLTTATSTPCIFYDRTNSENDRFILELTDSKISPVDLKQKDKIKTAKKTRVFHSVSDEHLIPSSIKKTKGENKVSSVKQPKKDQLLFLDSDGKKPGKGTLKRKRWQFNKLSEYNKGHDDDIFEGRDFMNIKNILKLEDSFIEESEEPMSEPPTPKPAFILTPRTSTCFSHDNILKTHSIPPSDFMCDRKSAEEYLYRRNQRNKAKLSSNLNNDMQTKFQSSSGVKISEIKQAENEADAIMDKLKALQADEDDVSSDNRSDYYFSDCEDDSPAVFCN